MAIKHLGWFFISAGNFEILIWSDEIVQKFGSNIEKMS